MVVEPLLFLFCIFGTAAEDPALPHALETKLPVPPSKPAWGLMGSDAKPPFQLPLVALKHRTVPGSPYPLSSLPCEGSVLSQGRFLMCAHYIQIELKDFITSSK